MASGLMHGNPLQVSICRNNLGCWRILAISSSGDKRNNIILSSKKVCFLHLIFLNIWIILAAVARIAAPLLYQLATINSGFITHTNSKHNRINRLSAF